MKSSTLLACLAAATFALPASATQIFANGNEDWMEAEIIWPGSSSASFSQLFNFVQVDVDLIQGVDEFTVNVYWGRNEGLGGIGPVSDTFTVSSPYGAGDASGFDGVMIRDGFRGIYLRYGYRDFTIPDSGSTSLCTLGGVLGVATLARRRLL